MGVSAEDYGNQQAQLLPPGAAWPRRPDSNLGKLLTGLGASLARLHNRALDLYTETGATDAFETLERWEAALGLPDSCSVQGAQTVQERINAVLAKLLGQGGLSRPDFIALAAAMGYPNEHWGAVGNYKRNAIVSDSFPVNTFPTSLSTLTVSLDAATGSGTPTGAQQVFYISLGK